MSTENLKKFGNFIKFLRNDLGMSGVEGAKMFAEDLGISLATVYNWEKREIKPPSFSFEKVSKCFAIDSKKVYDDFISSGQPKVVLKDPLFSDFYQRVKIAATGKEGTPPNPDEVLNILMGNLSFIFFELQLTLSGIQGEASEHIKSQIAKNKIEDDFLKVYVNLSTIRSVIEILAGISQIGKEQILKVLEVFEKVEAQNKNNPNIFTPRV